MEENKIIAEFMGWKYYPDDYLNNIKGVFRKPGKLPMLGFEYHKDWNALMRVVEKIESLGFCVTVYNEASVIKRTHGRFWHEAKRITAITDSKISSTYQAVLEFINWYNTQNKPHEPIN